MIHQPCFNGTFRDNELVFGGLKKLDTTSIGGYQAFYNYIKNMLVLVEKMPAEDSNVKVVRLNK